MIEKLGGWDGERSSGALVEGFVEHLRTVHFTLIAISTGLVLLIFSSRQYNAVTALVKIKEILNVALYYIWRERYEKHGVAGLRDLPRRPHNIRFRIPPEIVSLILRIREERRFGAVRVSLYLQRHFHAYVSPTTILKIFHRHHVGPVSQKKYRPGPKPPDAPRQVPGRSVEDPKAVDLNQSATATKY